ncbi:MAG: hemolysin III family protein [Acidimicrobiales bacterium]|nr:hemolysin III family protein [Acidimicrobiales bacterium]
MTATATAESVASPDQPIEVPQPVKPSLRGVSHRIAFVAAVTLTPIMIVAAPGIAPRFVIAIYCAATIGLFGVSALYHRVNWGARGHAVMRRLDHSMIFLAIAGTYTPIAIFGLPPGSRNFVLALVWGGSIVGISARLFWLRAPYAAIAIPYVVVGWAAIFVIDDVWREMGVAAFILLLVGGVLYTVGAVIYATRRPNPWPKTFGYHEIFHLFVISGAAVHYVVVAFIALPLA